jgi:hypothetical protein
MASINWLDTTTVWSSLGTISFPFSQSGTIYITRLGSIGSSGIGNIDGGHASAIYLPTQTLDGGGA